MNSNGRAAVTLEGNVLRLMGKLLAYDEVRGFIELVGRNRDDINFSAIGIEYSGLGPSQAECVRRKYGYINAADGHLLTHFPEDCNVLYKNRISRFVDIRDPLGR
ncbi:MAG: hypothetical protein HYS53_01645 [Candidatus Aenigmarchaeota archaeon]|nr:hypothetical protein [Candidatus Aenigmarchaeota archaeon]